MKMYIHCIRTILIALMSMLFMSGCLVVPNKATQNVTRSEKVIVPEYTILTLGPRRLLNKISHEIEELSPNIEVIDGLLFRDTAFPNGGWTLKELLQPETCSRVNKELNVDYLVLVGSLKMTSEEAEGVFLPLLFGAMSGEHSLTLSALIFDLSSGDQICQINSEGRGDEYTLYYVIFVVGFIPNIKTATIKGLANEVVSVITHRGTHEGKQIAIMAAETPVDTSSSYTTQLIEKAKHGDAEAQLQYYYYLRRQKPMEAHIWLCKAADQGHPQARYRLALLYENGYEGIKKDLIRAYIWYRLSENTGNSWGGKKAQILEKEYLDTHDLVIAKKTIKEWKPGQCMIELDLDQNK